MRYRAINIGRTIEVSIDITECENVIRLEHVVVNVSFSFHRRGDIKITLISPSGMPSEMLSFRDKDNSSTGIIASTLNE